MDVLGNREAYIFINNQITNDSINCAEYVIPISLLHRFPNKINKIFCSLQRAMLIKTLDLNFSTIILLAKYIFKVIIWSEIKLLWHVRHHSPMWEDLQMYSYKFRYLKKSLCIFVTNLPQGTYCNNFSLVNVILII